MAKKVMVERWLDEEENEHTTQASADYDDAKRKLVKQLEEYGRQHGADDVIDFIGMNHETVRRFIAATLTFRAEGGRKTEAPF